MESTLQSKCLKILFAKGFWAYNNHGTVFSGRGRPDLTGVTPYGQFFGLELKDGTKVTAIQRLHLDQIVKRGGTALEIRSVEDLNNFIEEVERNGKHFGRVSGTQDGKGAG